MTMQLAILMDSPAMLRKLKNRLREKYRKITLMKFASIDLRFGHDMWRIQCHGRTRFVNRFSISASLWCLILNTFVHRWAMTVKHGQSFGGESEPVITTEHSVQDHIA